MDAPDEFGGVGFGDEPFDPLAPPGFDEAGASLGAVLVVESLEPLPRGPRLVVDALGASVAGAGPSDGFLGWGEQVRLDPHELP